MQASFHFPWSPPIKTCIRCLEAKPRSQFTKERGRKDGLYPYCKPCKAKLMREANRKFRLTHDPVKRDRYPHRLMKDHGMSMNEYIDMLSRQAGGCAICGISQERLGRRLFVDHNHATGEIRGLLCHRCNAGVGLFMDDSTRLRRAAAYLEK